MGLNRTPMEFRFSKQSSKDVVAKHIANIYVIRDLPVLILGKVVGSPIKKRAIARALSHLIMVR